MENIAYADPLHHSIAQALVEFKVLTTDLLLKEVNYAGKQNSFRKVLRTLISKKKITTIQEKNNVQRYLFLDHKKIDSTNIFHDLKVAEICLKLRSHPRFQKLILSHMLESKTFSPDAIVSFPNVDMYVEVELTMKSEKKIRKKIEHYINTSKSVQVFYFFRQMRDLRRYSEVIKNIYVEMNESRIDPLCERKFILVLIDNIHEDFNIFNSQTYISNEMSSLGSVLRVNEP